MIINFNNLYSSNLTQVKKMNKNVTFGTWMRYSSKTEIDWINFFNKYKKAGTGIGAIAGYWAGGRQKQS